MSISHLLAIRGLLTFVRHVCRPCVLHDVSAGGTDNQQGTMPAVLEMIWLLIFESDQTRPNRRHITSYHAW